MASSSPSMRFPISLLLLLLLQLTTPKANRIGELSPQNITQVQVRNFFSNSPQNETGSFSIVTTGPNLQFPMQKSTKVILFGNSTIFSANNTFSLGFNPTNDESPNRYLSICYALIPVPTCVWVANRETPITNLTSFALEINDRGQLVVRDSANSILWASINKEAGVDVKLLENGNLVLLTLSGTVAWQSFDYPTDTWLPGMNLTTDRFLTSWKSYRDPSPGYYSLRLKPPEYGEFELVFNNTVPYWSTGKWTGNGFINVPEMLVPYIYSFYFIDPFKPTASFGFTERPLDMGFDPPLTRFQVDLSGQLRQFTWGTQKWDMFWSQPENKCSVYGMCGNFGVCNGETNSPCECRSGFSPVSESSWNVGDYYGGCRHSLYDVPCEEWGDGFEKVSLGIIAGASSTRFEKDWDACQDLCLASCSCVGVSYNGNSMCYYFYGSLSNLKNLSSDSAVGDTFYLKVNRNGRRKAVKKPSSKNALVLSSSIVGSFAVLVLVLMVLVVVLIMKKEKRKKKEEAAQLQPASNLKVFSYKELQTATRDFSDKLGHGGFGAVFHGELSDNTVVAVKRLDRPGGGEKEFQSEVCTIGNIQHVNLVRLRGFCSENSHRLLVYDYMPNGALSVYLRRDGPNLSWDVRFRLAIGMARGIAYLHEECRDCIIHCDIKPENVLLDSDYTAKVSDFGLARLLGREFSRLLVTMRGTWGYVAPEWISGVAITTKADVYSYGMTLIELLGGRRNVEARHSGGRNDTADNWFFPPWAAQQIIEGNVRAVLDDRLGCTYNIEEAKRVGLVAVWCIQDSEATRPTMGMVVKMLEGVVEVAIPPAPKLLQALVSGESFCGIKADSGVGLSNGSDFSGYNTRLSSCSESSVGNASSIVNEIVPDNQ